MMTSTFSPSLSSTVLARGSSRHAAQALNTCSTSSTQGLWPRRPARRSAVVSAFLFSASKAKTQTDTVWRQRLAADAPSAEELRLKLQQLVDGDGSQADTADAALTGSEHDDLGLGTSGSALRLPTKRDLPNSLPIETDPQPEITLLQRIKQPPHQDSSVFWGDFMAKCRLAWGVFFPPPPPGSPLHRSPLGTLMAARAAGKAPSAVLSPKEVVMSRLQLVLMADRCGVAPEQLLALKSHTLGALAQYMGTELADMEVQVSAMKPNGERLTMTMGFSEMLHEEQMRDSAAAHYEHEDDDDYFTAEEEAAAGFKIAPIAEADAPGRLAATVAAGSAPANKDD